MICENCKNVIQEDSKVCIKCGVKVYKEVICLNIINDVECGVLISSNESVCLNCEWSIIEKVFKIGIYMSNVLKDEILFKNLVLKGDEGCSKCGSMIEIFFKKVVYFVFKM